MVRPHEAPLLFDDQLQAKPAYYGITDPSRLAYEPRALSVTEAKINIDGDREEAWDYLPNVVLPSSDDDDGVDIFLAETNLHIGRDGSLNGEGIANVSEQKDGNFIEAKLPLTTRDNIEFDLRSTDGRTDANISWSDQSHTQETTLERFGTLSFIEAVRLVDILKTNSAPVIDGEIDMLWAKANVSLLWDADKLYALFEVSDPTLDLASTNPWEQDFVEIFTRRAMKSWGPTCRWMVSSVSISRTIPQSEAICQSSPMI